MGGELLSQKRLLYYGDCIVAARARLNLDAGSCVVLNGPTDFTKMSHHLSRPVPGTNGISPTRRPG